MCCFWLGFSGIRFVSLSYGTVMSKPGPGGDVQKLGAGRALLLFFSCLRPGAREPAGVPRAEQPKVRQSPVQIFTSSSVSSCSRSPPVACSGWGPGDRCWLCGTADVRWCTSLSAVAVLGPFGLFLRDAERERLLPQLKQVAQGCICRKRGLIPRGGGKRGSMTNPGVFPCNCLT